MNKCTDFIGVDISKLTFDVWSKDLGHHQFENNPKALLNFINY